MAGDALWRLPSADAPRLPGYRILYEIGRGGSGTVFLAEPLAGPKVAIKTLASLDNTRPSEVLPLLTEARLLSSLHSENVVRLLAVGESPLPYMVLEYVHGESLSAMLEHAGSVPAPLVLLIGAKICDALAEAHALQDPTV